MQTLFRTVAAIAALSTPALAQFPGDLFFSDPAPLSLDGAPVSLELAGFYGDVPVGATAFEILYEPSELELGSVSVTGTFAATLHRRDLGPGRAGFTVFNDASLDTPIGTVAWLTLEVTPLLSPGASTTVAVVPRQALGTLGQPYPSAVGGSAQVLVVEPSALVVDGGRIVDTPPMLVPASPWERHGPPPSLVPPGGLRPSWTRELDARGPVYTRRLQQTLAPTADASDR